MHRMFSSMFVVAVLLTGSAFAQSDQSLGDLARANREKLQAQQASGTAPHVITNQDLPADSRGIPEPDPSQPMSEVSGVQRSFDDGSSGQRFHQQRTGGQAGGELRGRIQEQQNRIANLQARIDEMNASIRPGGSAQFEGPSNRSQARQMQRVAMMQERLDYEKQRLSMMQEAARRGGMHTRTYDP